MVAQFITENPVPAKIPKLGIYLPLELKEALLAIANKERRSGSQMAVILLEEAIESRRQVEQSKSETIK